MLLTWQDEMLILQSQMSNLHKPSQRTLNAFKYWFNTPFPVLGGQSKHYLDARDGLVSLTAPRDIDLVSRLLRRYWPAKVSKQDDSREKQRKKKGLINLNPQ